MCIKKISIWFLFIFSLMHSSISAHQNQEKMQDESTSDHEVFVPTNEWKTVKKGQPIPPGLHVRMNLETGINEAKLLDKGGDDISKKTAMSTVSLQSKEEHMEKKNVKIIQTAHHVDGVHVMESSDGEQTVFTNGKLTPQQLQDAVQNLKFEDVEVASDEDVERVKGKFRSMDELKEELAELNLGMRSEAEEVSQLMQQFLQVDTSEEVQLSVLTDLEYITHHVDAARDFVQGNGIRLIVIPTLNSSSFNLQSAAAKLLGAASQGNLLVQKAALKEGVIRLLLRQVALGVRNPLDQEHHRRKAAVYAISCLVRGFPAGQRNLIDEGGLSVLAELFDETDADIKVRITTLLHDLVLERYQASNTNDKNEYKALRLEKSLLQHGWCERIVSLLFSPNIDRRGRRDDLSAAAESKWPIRPEHDILEKVVSAMIVLSPQCKNQFKEGSSIVQELVSSYKELAEREEMTGNEDNFYSELLQLVSKLSTSINSRDEL